MYKGKMVLKKFNLKMNRSTDVIQLLWALINLGS